MTPGLLLALFLLLPAAPVLAQTAKRDPGLV